ncbi:MAG: shikimate kinase [Candidatus Anoxymicrobium japonicum]|uniref:Shikimate kinase n=1 Tax=Candidatus Anoxymicrobium japonicum TaxID=2013648 RepID=A0A2N3G6U7_9ACTN|nr:MAG: shikimate kinase [Candidatus Anoxymicrobium japonicum]
MDRSNIVLIGFMYAGKSTVGGLLARSAGKPFVDTDCVIEQETGATVSELFERDGEPRFREIERKVVARVTGGTGLVIALGGGAVLDPANVQDAKKNGIIYYLSVTPSTVASRAALAGGRPLLDGKSTEEIAALLEQRREFYLSAAEVTVEADSREASEIAREIERDFARRTRV